MKKMLLMAAVLVSAACGEKKAETVPMDSSAVAPMTPATDSASMMPTDTGMRSDTGMMHTDSTMARDSMAR